MSSTPSDLRFYDLGNCASGSWYVIHLLAANGETEALKTVLKTFSKRFVCPKCRFHIRDYLKSNPLPSVPTTSRAFEWTVDFHNAVNVRLGKATLTDEERDDLFLELTSKADDDEKKVMQGGDCEGCSGVGSGSLTSLRETIEKTRVRRSSSFPPSLTQTNHRQQWPSINVSYSK
jgi:hypothetical protein